MQINKREIFLKLLKFTVAKLADHAANYLFNKIIVIKFFKKKNLHTLTMKLYLLQIHHIKIESQRIYISISNSKQQLQHFLIPNILNCV